MTNGIYKTPAEFDRAIKQAASKAEGDTGERYRQALRDRFLCRVFSDSESRFILKGGSGMLARVPNARATRDADFATQKKSRPMRSWMRLTNCSRPTWATSAASC